MWFKFLADVQAESLTDLKSALDNLEIVNFNNNILSFTTIQKDVSEVKSDSQWAKTPFEDHHTEMEIKKLVKFGGFKIDDNVVLMITVPLISLEKSKIFHIQVMPKVYENVATTIKLQNKLLVVNRDMQKHFFIEKNELETSATKIKDELFWKNAIKWDAQECCEMSIILGNEKAKNETCKGMTFKFNDTLVLSTSNGMNLSCYQNIK
jgi:hypothetical protein